MLQALALLIKSTLPPATPLRTVVSEVPISKMNTLCGLPPPSSVRFAVAILAVVAALKTPAPKVPAGHVRVPVAPQLERPELVVERSGVPVRTTVGAVPEIAV